jgi:hypothetical protein
MRSRCGLVLAMLLPLTGAHAQVPEVVHTLTWSEVDASTGAFVSNPNGIIEPGEAAMIRVSVSFTPIGTPVSYGGGTAPVAALHGTPFRLNATAAEGVWSHFSALPGFGPPIGFWDPSGELTAGGAGQAWQPLPWQPQPGNPLIDLWTGRWTPASYEARQVQFQMSSWITIGSPPPPLVYVFDGTNYASIPATPVWDSVSFPVVPAPGALVVLSFAALLGHGRRKRPCTSCCP